MNKHLHIMGIAGSGAGAFAKLAEAHGYRISGCDRLLEGHDPSHLDGVDVLIVSPAILSYDPENLELIAARKRGIEVFTWQEFLGKYLMGGDRVVGVCGTHGKTTIAAMIAYILEGAGLDPTYLLGAKVRGGENFRKGGGNLFVVEADEFNDNFLNYPVFFSVCVALEFDHPEYFKDFEKYLASFERFVRRGEGLLCYKEDRGVRELLERLCNWKGRAVGFSSLYEEDLPVPGDYNRINAQAAYLAVRSLGVSKGKINELLKTFPGVERRLELKKVVGEVKIYNDYAHHPGQLRAVLETLSRLHSDERVVVVFQPHMFSRTKVLFSDFVRVLRRAAVYQVLLCDIFPSREKDPGDISSSDLVEAVDSDRVRYLPKERISDYLGRISAEVIAFIGAGDVNQLIDEL